MGFHVSLGECTCSRGEEIPATPNSMITSVALFSREHNFALL